MTGPIRIKLYTANKIALGRLNHDLILRGLEKRYEDSTPAGLEEILGPELDLPDFDGDGDDE